MRVKPKEPCGWWTQATPGATLSEEVGGLPGIYRCDRGGPGSTALFREGFLLANSAVCLQTTHPEVGHPASPLSIRDTPPCWDFFEKDENFGVLGTLPGLVAYKDGEESESPEPGEEQFSDEEGPDA